LEVIPYVHCWQHHNECTVLSNTTLPDIYVDNIA
jgi:hypothetical protein